MEDDEYMLVEDDLKHAGDDFVRIAPILPKIVKEKVGETDNLIYILVCCPQGFRDVIIKAQQSIIDTRLINYSLSRGFSSNEGITQSGWIRVDLKDTSNQDGTDKSTFVVQMEQKHQYHCQQNDPLPPLPLPPPPPSRLPPPSQPQPWTENLLQEVNEEDEFEKAVEVRKSLVETDLLSLSFSQLSKLLGTLDRVSAELICRLSEDGVEYTPHQCNYQVTCMCAEKYGG
jgi:hypothetical protein